MYYNWKMFFFFLCQSHYDVFLPCFPFFFQDVQSADEVTDNNWISDEDILQGNVSEGISPPLCSLKETKHINKEGKVSVLLADCTVLNEGFGRSSRQNWGLKTFSLQLTAWFAPGEWTKKTKNKKHNEKLKPLSSSSCQNICLYNNDCHEYLIASFVWIQHEYHKSVASLTGRKTLSADLKWDLKLQCWVFGCWGVQGLLVKVSLSKKLNPKTAPDVLVSSLHGCQHHQSVNVSAKCKCKWAKMSQKSYSRVAWI